MLNRARGLYARLMAPVVLLCSYPALAEEGERLKFNMPEGVTPISREIQGLHMEMFWWCVGIGVVVFGVMFYSMIMHRKSRGVKPANFHDNTWLEILWTAIPLMILVLMAIPASKSLIKLYDASEAEVDVMITGYQWRWKYDYLEDDVSFFSNLSTPQDEVKGFAPQNSNYLLEVDEPLVLPVGQKIRFLVTAADVLHAWWVPELGVKRDAVPGFVNEAWAIIKEPGIYRGQCAELCGKNHGFMPIVVEAKPQDEYRQWLADKKQAAEELQAMTEQTFSFDELYERGERIYGQWCAACHQANGEGVPGTFPSLKEGSRAVGPIEEHMDVVINGVSGTAMQAFGEQLSEVDIAAVVTYERNAWGNNMGDMAQPIDVYNHKQGN